MRERALSGRGRFVLPLDCDLCRSIWRSCDHMTRDNSIFRPQDLSISVSKLLLPCLVAGSSGGSDTDGLTYFVQNPSEGVNPYNALASAERFRNLQSTDAVQRSTQTMIVTNVFDGGITSASPNAHLQICVVALIRAAGDKDWLYWHRAHVIGRWPEAVCRSPER